MSASAPTGWDLVWPAEPRARALATELYGSVAERPLVSVHNGLPARFLAEDLPFTDPINLLVSHDQGVQGLLRAHGIRADFSPMDGWQTQQASRQAFELLWRHMVDTQTRPWMVSDSEEISSGAGLPSFRISQDPGGVYDELAARLATNPLYPRRVLAAANLAHFATSDDPADDLQAHRVLAEDPDWAGRVVPTFSPDRYLDPARRGWRTDADLLAEVTGVDTENLSGFLDALRARRSHFGKRGALATEHHASDVPLTRLPSSEAEKLYGLARSGELLPDEALALEGHLLWESGRMAADDGLIMALYPPAGFHSATIDLGHDDAGVADRVRSLLDDVGTASGLRLRLFTIDTHAYVDEILPLAQQHPALTAVPPTRFADDPAVLRAVRVAAVASVGSARSLGVVDDMSGPFALGARHSLGRRLDAGALAELVLDGRLSEDDAHTALVAAVGQSDVGQPAVG